jgi:hypothetical protein
MGSHWKRVEKLEQRAFAQEPETYDLTVLGDYLTDDELALIEQGEDIMGRLAVAYEADCGQSAGTYIKEWLKYASGEELELLDHAVTALDHAKQEHKAKTQRGSTGDNGHTPTLHKQKIRGRPWNN